MIVIINGGNNIMYVIKNLANGKYYKRLEEHNNKLDAELDEATKFDSQERAISKASILHAELSTLGLGINFKVEVKESD